jgi:hypothetical protein
MSKVCTNTAPLGWLGASAASTLATALRGSRVPENSETYFATPTYRSHLEQIANEKAPVEGPQHSCGQEGRLHWRRRPSTEDRVTHIRRVPGTRARSPRISIRSTVRVERLPSNFAVGVRLYSARVGLSVPAWCAECSGGHMNRPAGPDEPPPPGRPRNGRRRTRARRRCHQ